MTRFFNARTLTIALPALWLMVFFVLPLAVVLKIALSQATLASPPILPVWLWTGEGLPRFTLNLDSFAFLFEDRLYFAAYFNSIKIAFFSTILTLFVAYPIAWFIARAPNKFRSLLLMAVILPFWTSFLLRVYAWITLLNTSGLINQIALNLGLIAEPLPLLRNDFALYVGITYTYLPFMILPLYAVLVKIETGLLDAAADLGATPFTQFFTIILPLSMPGIIAGSMLVFIPAIGEFIIPTLLGGPDTLMIGRVLWDEFFANRDWPVASALAIIMLLVIVLPLILLRGAQSLWTSKT